MVNFHVFDVKLVMVVYQLGLSVLLGVHPLLFSMVN